MSDIKNIIFDVGDVLVSFRYRDYMRDLGFEDETVEFLTENMIFTDFWEGLDAGREDVDDAVEIFTKRYPELADRIVTFWDNIENIVAEFEYSAPLIHELKGQGYKIYLLSNYPDKLSDLHWPQFSFLNETDGYVISAKVKVAKPEPAIFNLLLDRYGITAEESLFIDDNEKNIIAANELGFHAIHFTGIDELRSELDKILGDNYVRNQ